MILNEKIKIWIDQYFAHIDEVGEAYHVNQDPMEGEEGYKFVAVDNFQKYFNLDAPDLVTMLEKAIISNNLVAGPQYLPKRMLVLFAKEYPKETRDLLGTLFNISYTINERLNQTQIQVNDLMAKRNASNGRSDKSYIGLRFMSLLLGFRFPNECNAIKPRNWRVFCKFIDPEFNIPQHSTTGEQYLIYEKYIDALMKQMKGNIRIDELRKKLCAGLNFQDDNFRWMAQDIIYIGSGEFDTKEATVADTTTSDPEETIESNDDFKSEDDMEIHLAKQWSNIKLFSGYDIVPGIKLHGGQYPVPGTGKSIDLLAYSKEKKMWLILELKTKKNPDSYKAVGQLQTYMGYIKNNLAKKDESVRGLVITGSYNEDIENAISVAGNMGWLVYSVRVQYTDFALQNPIEQDEKFENLFSKH